MTTRLAERAKSLCNTAVVFEHRVRPGIISWTTLIVLVSLLFASTKSFAAGENTPLRDDASPTTVGRTPAVNGPTFRLGDAARPFGWSTVVSDFNRDGIPDFAIADRTPQHESEFRYEIEFAVAGRTPYDVTFTSPLQALTLQPDDVDGDRDVDIVVVDPISNDVVAVWLNDGDGHFAQADPRAFSRHRRSMLDASAPSTDDIACLSQERNQHSVSGSFETDATQPVSARHLRVSRLLASITSASSASPRAPPRAFLS